MLQYLARVSLTNKITNLFPRLFSHLATYTKSVSEDIAAGSSIQQVTATDADSGVNQMLTYDIVDTTILPNSELDDLDASVNTHVVPNYHL